MANPMMILTDRSTYLPADLVARCPIRVMPLTFNWDGMTYRDSVDIQADEFYRRLTISDCIPTTSQFTASELREQIHPLLEERYDVLVLPISNGLSSAYNTAVNEVQKYPKGRVTVLDTKRVSMPLGFQVLTTARAA